MIVVIRAVLKKAERAKLYSILALISSEIPIQFGQDRMSPWAQLMFGGCRLGSSGYSIVFSIEGSASVPKTRLNLRQKQEKKLLCGKSRIFKHYLLSRG